MKKKKKMYKINFILSLIIIVLIVSIYFYIDYKRNKSAQVSEQILADINQTQEEVEKTKKKAQSEVLTVVLNNAQEDLKVESLESTDNYETLKATEILAKEGFLVMPYMYPDINTARDLVNAGAAAVMPLAAPIGSNKGLCTKEFIQILIDEIELPIIVDAGIGKPSQACEAMEIGAAAVMANTAIATAGNITAMAEAFKKAIEAGRTAYLAKLGRVIEKGAVASSPLTGFLQD